LNFDWVSDESDTEAGAPPVFVLDGPALPAVFRDGPALPAVFRPRGHTHEDIDTIFVAVRAMAFSDAQQP
jgi:hypothetical protein